MPLAAIAGNGDRRWRFDRSILITKSPLGVVGLRKIDGPGPHFRSASGTPRSAFWITH